MPAAIAPVKRDVACNSGHLPYCFLVQDRSATQPFVHSGTGGFDRFGYNLPPEFTCAVRATIAAKPTTRAAIIANITPKRKRRLAPFPREDSVLRFV